MDRRGYDGCEVCGWLYFAFFMFVVLSPLFFA